MARFVYFHFLLCFFYQMCVHTLCQMHLCLCLRLCVCVCGGCPAFVAVGVVCVCVCVGVGVPVCYIFYSFVRLKRACWTLVAIRIEPGPLVERIRQRGFSRGLRVTGSGGQGVRGAAHIEQKNAITHETQQGKQSGQTGISSREECTITS